MVSKLLALHFKGWALFMGNFFAEKSLKNSEKLNGIEKLRIDRRYNERSLFWT